VEERTSGRVGKILCKPETITSGKEADGVNSLNDTPASYRWNIERLELTVAFAYQEGHEIKFDV
jgi:hypothetical protein